MYVWGRDKDRGKEHICMYWRFGSWNKINCPSFVFNYYLTNLTIKHSCECYIQACGCKKNKTDEEIKFSFFYWINKINKLMKYLADLWGGGCLFGDERLLRSGWTVLSGDALGTASDSTAVWPLFGLFMCSRFQTPAKMLLVEKIWLVEK